MFISLALLVSLAMVWIGYNYFFKLPQNFPPGPRFALPILGVSVWFLPNIKLGISNNYDVFYVLFHAKAYLGLKRMRDVYGDIYGFAGAKSPTVILNSFELIQDVLARPEVSGRPQYPALHYVRGGGLSLNESFPGVLASHGQTWREQRRFTLTCLKDFGLGRNRMVEIIKDEVSELLKDIEAEDSSQPRSVRYMFNLSSLNCLWRILTGERLARSDPKLLALVKTMDKALKEFTNPLAVAALHSIPLTQAMEWLGFSFAQNQRAMLAFSEASLEDHKQSRQGEDRYISEDFIDAYLEKMKSTTDINSSFYGLNGDLNLKALLLDLFMAGLETVSTTMNWAIFFMAKYQAIQQQVQKELDQVTNGCRLVEWSDQHNTPYTEAVLHEIQRRGDLVSFSLVRVVSQDISVAGYDIPKDTTIFANIGEVMHDPKHFPDPYKFDPSRFIDGQSGKFKPHPRVIPFGSGKRKCLGEGLARAELYLFFCSILQNFTIEPAIAPEQMSEDAQIGVILSPQPYEVCFKRRTSVKELVT